MSNTIWLLTEEKPKIHVVKTILELHYKFEENPGEEQTIIPLIKEKGNEGQFDFRYELKGITIPDVNHIYIKIVSGHSSFVDYLIFDQQSEPLPADLPKYVVEETKTDDKESRNTNAYQRSSKFVFCEYYYDKTIPKYMLYDYSDGNREISGTATHKFGMRMLKTIGVNLIGINDTYLAFDNLNEFINVKNEIAKNGRSHNVPLSITKVNDKLLQVSAKLDKGSGKSKNRISNDPSIGAVSIICAVLRKLGWKHNIELINHNLLEQNVSMKKGNKLLFIMKKLDITFKGFNLDWNSIDNNINYWRYNTTSEKIASIFYHIYMDNYWKNKKCIFDNHAGCGKSYFLTKSGAHISIDKKTPIPDLVIYDSERNHIDVIEAEKSENYHKALLQLEGFEKFIDEYIKVYYGSNITISKSVLTYGKNENPENIFYLTKNGKFKFLNNHI